MKENKKVQEIIIDLKNAITRKNMILEKFRKKNHQIWSIYEGEIPVTNFNSELKREISHIVVFFTSPTWHNSKNNFNAQRSHKRLFYGGSARSLPQAGRRFDCHGAQVVFIFQKNDDHYVLNRLMHFINTSALQVQWLGGSAVIYEGLCSSPLLGRFFFNFFTFFHT